MLLAKDNLQQRRLWRNYLLMFILGMCSLLGTQKLWKAAAMCNTRFDLLNANSVCTDRQEQRSEWDYEPLRQKLVQTAQDYSTSGTVPHLALYFRDLKHGPRFAVREDEIFSPVSLLKVPIMMVILHQAENDPELLNERLTYKKEYGKDFIMGKPDESLLLHESYTIRELLQKMIRYSDNNSSYLLLDKINELGLQERSNTFSDLGTMKLLMSGELDNTRLISLVNVFMTLYNANYLSPDSSQYALELLTQTDFNQGIVSGVPEDIRVAHKFGIRFGANDEYGIRYGATEQSELHDCGIVYHPIAPYVLCVLTAGADINTASAAISDISHIVYEQVDALQPDK